MIRTACTECGIVRGLPAADPRITSYKGIPYAAPPVGRNRWRPPQPCKPWEGEFEAFTFSPIPMQAPIRANPDDLYDREFHVDPDTPMSEDCLYLNVWAPGDGRKDLPVFVWYYGGGLQVGYTSEMEFDGERIARRGIVVVTVNYRLNCFGFLCHPEITAENPKNPANFGFMDQQAATRWVKRNIAAFGGNPDNITIGGQSAGGMSVAAQLTCRENKGLFQRAILESGLFIPPYPKDFGRMKTLSEAEKWGERFFRLAGVSTLEEARSLPAMTLRDKLLEWESLYGWATTFGATVDGVFSIRGGKNWLRENDWPALPLLIGNTDNEFIETPSASDEEALNTFAEQYEKDADAVLSCFSHPATLESIQAEGGICSMEFATRLIAELLPKEIPMFSYLFSADIPGWDHPGAFHSCDIWFFFETLSKCWRPYRGVHYDLARQMCDYWCNFIRTGNPNGTDSQGECLPNWPAFSTNYPVRMHFDSTSHAEYDPPSPLQELLIRRFIRNCGIDNDNP